MEKQQKNIKIIKHYLKNINKIMNKTSRIIWEIIKNILCIKNFMDLLGNNLHINNISFWIIIVILLIIFLFITIDQIQKDSLKERLNQRKLKRCKKEIKRFTFIAKIEKSRFIIDE